MTWVLVGVERRELWHGEQKDGEQKGGEQKGDGLVKSVVRSIGRPFTGAKNGGHNSLAHSHRQAGCSTHFVFVWYSSLLR